jgi:hypothetical protein
MAAKNVEIVVIEKRDLPALATCLKNHPGTIAAYVVGRTISQELSGLLFSKCDAWAVEFPPTGSPNMTEVVVPQFLAFMPKVIILADTIEEGQKHAFRGRRGLSGQNRNTRPIKAVTENGRTAYYHLSEEVTNEQA